jgi:hypothetical protein
MESLKFFMTKRVIVSILAAIVLLWVVNAVMGRKQTSIGTDQHSPEPAQKTVAQTKQSPAIRPTEESVPEAEPQPFPTAPMPETTPGSGLHAGPSASDPGIGAAAAPETEIPEPHGEVSEDTRVKGAAFVDAVIEPLDYELNERFYGWRPNDIIDVTDNVENYQRGVLEVTRRSVRILTERISRTGTTVAFNTNLENAMNWLMVKADAYWFPAPEAKYREALDELERYKQSLERGRESFFTRSDNLIPLLQVFEDLLGSCEENLVKQKEKDGREVSFFTADDYFFYTKGVTGAIHTILEAVAEDFGATIESRKGTEDLHAAIESLHHAYEIDPLIILNSDPDSLWANHRANMAAPISHAKFYLRVLINTLST